MAKKYIDCNEKVIGTRRYRCFFDLALMVIGGKWKPVMLDRLVEHTTLRFSDLRRSIPTLSERMLTRQLRELEADGLITRKVFEAVPPHVEYSLTELGQSLIPVLQMLREWGERFEQHMVGDRYLAAEGFEPCSRPQGKQQSSRGSVQEE